MFLRAILTTVTSATAAPADCIAPVRRAEQARTLVEGCTALFQRPLFPLVRNGVGGPDDQVVVLLFKAVSFTVWVHG